MVLDSAAELTERNLPIPEPGPRQVLVRVIACGVCRTDLHIRDAELHPPRLPLVLGHEVVGTVEAVGSQASRFAAGARVGIPWLGSTCGVCGFCRRGEENLCDQARFTGFHMDGGYAEFAVADERYCHAIPAHYGDVQAAPLLCAGLIGFRALRAAGDPKRIGLYGFGASAHIVAQIAKGQGREVFAFTRSGDVDGQKFAVSLGATWAGGSDQSPPEPLDAAIIFAPVGSLVPTALKAVRKGGSVVCAGIHMSEIPAFSYDILWGERSVRSVANLTRKDGEDFFEIVEKIPVHPTTETFPLGEAETALSRLRKGQLKGAAVLSVTSTPSSQ
ncbi:MAG TPA: zinc-dependent alcohol dehydrogenase family protein [Gemmatimonadales bacterium]|nr:zinc-dependent alcohol dehydrogenase family protein [Gemmatimonadales bacterium]